MRRQNFRPRRRFERLEDRRMMAADIEIENDILHIEGTENRDLIVITADPDDPVDEVLVTITNLETGEILEQEDEEIEDFNEIIVDALAGDDIVRNFTDIRAKLFGNTGSDTLESRGGDDVLEGGTGTDTLIGGRGNDTYVFAGLGLGTDNITEVANVDTDTLDFSEFGQQVMVNLATVFNPNSPNPQFTHAVTSFGQVNVSLFNATGIENVKGTQFDDVLRGNARGNHLLGNDGDDNFTGAGGNDTLEGGIGSDVYEFAGTGLGTDDIVEAANSEDDLLRFGGMTTGLTIDISKSGPDFAVNNSNLRLRLSNDTAIERVFGTAFSDTIIGNGRNNTLKGLDGIDAIRGNGGADRLEGGDSIDVLTTDALDEVFGGLGRDFFDGQREVANTAPPRARYLDWGLI
jgi:Ca2+-binding RTX toxin-like protein